MKSDNLVKNFSSFLRFISCALSDTYTAQIIKLSFFLHTKFDKLRITCYPLGVIKKKA